MQNAGKCGELKFWSSGKRMVSGSAFVNCESSSIQVASVINRVSEMGLKHFGREIGQCARWKPVTRIKSQRGFQNCEGNSQVEQHKWTVCFVESNYIVRLDVPVNQSPRQSPKLLYCLEQTHEQQLQF